jgi:type II secretory pathway pseudopilin PulG
MNFHHNNKGMTVVEMLMVLGLLSMLFGLSFYLWNAMDIFRKTRDTQRINDIQVLDTALKTILTTESNVNLGEENIIYTSLKDASSTCGSYNLTPLYAPFSYRCSATPTDINGNGWLPVNFKVSKIFIIEALPIDPLNNKDYFYAYQVKQRRYKLTVRFESKNNIPKMANDGGFEPTLYEVGSNLFIPSPHSGLVGYWSFDESTGTIANDLSGYGNNGTMYSGTAPTDLHSTSSCKIGYCSSFDGVDDYIKVSNSSSLKPNLITIASWVNIPSLDGQYRWVVRTGWGGAPYFFGLNDNNKFAMVINDVSAMYTGGSSITVGWHYVVGTYNGTQVKLYINGVLVWTYNYSISMNKNMLSVFVGGGDSNGDDVADSQFWKGMIDEIRIYNRALSDQEIKALYDATK